MLQRRSNKDQKTIIMHVCSDQVSKRSWDRNLGGVLILTLYQKSDIGQTLILTCLLVSRTAESSSKETQEDVHRENGRDEEPVEEYRCALRQLVSVCLRVLVLRKRFGYSRVKVIMCVGGSEKWERERKGNACVCLYVCVGRGNASQTRHFVQSRCHY